MDHEDLSDLNKLWQDQPAEKVPMTVEDIRNRAGRLEKRVGWRNLREYAGAVFTLAICIALATREKNVTVLIGGGLIVLATLYIVYHLHRFGTVRSMPV
jgi:NaMN:DMB phosphoribosyltransferase